MEKVNEGLIVVKRLLRAGREYWAIVKELKVVGKVTFDGA